MKRAVLAVTVGSIALALSLGGACSKDDPKPVGPDPSLKDVIYEGTASEPALEKLLEATLVDDETFAATFTWPLDGDKGVPFEPPPRFCWQIAGAAASLEPVIEPDGDPLPSPFVPRFVPRSPASKVTASLVHAWLDGTREAHAQTQASMSGIGYFLVFSSDSDEKLLRVFTTEHDYTPDADSLAKLRNAPQPIHAIVTNANFAQDRVAQGGGPYQGVKITFSML